jgi:hypothetical protein
MRAHDAVPAVARSSTAAHATVSATLATSMALVCVGCVDDVQLARNGRAQ